MRALLRDPLASWDKFVIGPHIPTLAIRTAHVRVLASLPDIHNDPFDRIPAAQELAERQALVTRDTDLARYDIPVIW